MSSETWKNRIVGQGEKAAKEFNFNPLNWRVHPDLQQQALEAILKEVGWVQQVIVNRTTGNLIDGEARIKKALELGENTPVPFIEIEVSLEEEKKILRLLDAITNMALTDLERLRDLSSSFDFESVMLQETFQLPEISDVNLDDFFIPLEDAPPDIFKLVLNYSEADFEQITSALSKYDQSPEEVIKNLLL